MPDAEETRRRTLLEGVRAELTAAKDVNVALAQLFDPTTQDQLAGFGQCRACGNYYVDQALPAVFFKELPSRHFQGWWLGYSFTRVSRIMGLDIIWLGPCNVSAFSHFFELSRCAE